MPFTQYVRELRKYLRLGDGTEGTHRPALAALLEALGEGITATAAGQRIISDDSLNVLALGLAVV